MEESGRETGSSTCQCYVNTSGFALGQRQQDPSQCLRNCKSQFLDSVLSGWGEGSSWPDGCKSLNNATPLRQFWALYWCDSTFCGVGISQTGGLGQDPNVDLIINTCQNIGFYSILDPGPPPPGFRCNTDATAPGTCSITMTPAPDSTSAPHPASTMPATTTRAGPEPGVIGSGSRSATPAATESSAETSAAAAGTGSPTSGNKMTAQGKAAVAICSVLALLLLVTFVLVWLRRRKRRKNASFHRALRSRRGLPHDIQPAGSPTPLISPTSSAVGTRTIMTPPLRLRDRKFLPALLRPGGSRSPSPPLTPLTPAYSPFPSSPICSPTTNKLVPRHERTLTPRSAAAYTGYPPSPAPPVSSSSSRAFLHGAAATPTPTSPTAHHSPSSAYPLPVPHMHLPGAWPTDATTANTAADGSRASASASSCYTVAAAEPGGGTSTARSSLRHTEIPIGVGAPLSTGIRSVSAGASARDTPPPPPPVPPGSPSPSGAGAGTGTGGVQPTTAGTSKLRMMMMMMMPESGGGGGGSHGETEAGGSSYAGGSPSSPPLPPPPPPYQDQDQERYQYGHPYPGPASSASPTRPPRPHDSMLRIPDLVTPASRAASAGRHVGYCVKQPGDGDRGGTGRGGVGASASPPPPPPLSPPPTKALPTPPPPPSSAGPSSAMSSPRLAKGLVSGPGSGTGAAILHAGSGDHSGPGTSDHHHGPSPPAAAGYRPEEMPADHCMRHPGIRGSWGSWSGTGTLIGGVAGDHGHRADGGGKGAAMGEVRRAGFDSYREPVSPRTSEASGVSEGAAGVSRMSSMREDGAFDGLV